MISKALQKSVGKSGNLSVLVDQMRGRFPAYGGVRRFNGSMPNMTVDLGGENRLAAVRADRPRPIDVVYGAAMPCVGGYQW